MASINASTSGAGGVITTADNTGILNLQTAGTTAIGINASQLVGIGNSSPSNSLSISNPSIYAALSFDWTGDNAAKARIGANHSTGEVQYWATTNYFPTFYAGNSERMRIDSSGGVSIGATATYLGTERFSVTATAAGWPMSLNCTTSAANGLYIRYSTSPNNTGSDFFAAVDSTATRVVFRSNGGLANYSGNNVNLSDQREKTNIELAGSYLDKICAIPVKTFNYIDQNMENDGGLTLGVIAQDVQKVAPELVTESNWGTEAEPKERLSIYQTDLQYALMKCIQEQQTIINDLKARVTALEAK